VASGHNLLVEVAISSANGDLGSPAAAAALAALIGERSAEDQLGVISGGRRIALSFAPSGLAQAAEIEREIDMLTSKLASVAGLIGATVLAAAIPAATSAFAATPDQLTVKVSTADLNLNSEAGARVALARIRHAAKEICGDSGARTSLDQSMQLQACVNGVVERAVAASNQPTLVAVSQGRHVAAMASAAR
jgi:UrcA family protein